MKLSIITRRAHFNWGKNFQEFQCIRNVVEFKPM